MTTNLYINSGFLGENPLHPVRPSVHNKYSGHDSPELLEKNLKIKPDNWYYRNISIDYLYNNLGHRCKRISEIDLNNYILFIGCSHTEGVGNRIIDTFPYIVSKELKCDYYNLSLGGSGIDTMMHNLNIWLHKIKHQPKYIVWQWPEPTRYLSYDGKNINRHGTWQDDTNTNNFIIAGDMSNYFHARIKLAESLLEQLPNVVEIDFFTKTNKNIFFERLDLARDDLHYGVESNKNLASKLYDRMHKINTI
jgi:hypothetical protein